MKFWKSRWFHRHHVAEVVAKQQDDGDAISSGNTEDTLISSRTSSETITRRKNCQKCANIPYRLLTGIFLILWSVGTLYYPPYDLMMDLRLNMIPGLPPFEWWKNIPPDHVLIRVYIFNITNAEEFLNGTDSKLKVEEVGPIVYKETLVHSNVTFNTNDTLSYVATRKAVYVPEMNTVGLNDTLVVPNLGVLIIPSYFHDADVFTKTFINMMIRSLDSQPLVKTTVYKYLWNISDPLLDVGQKILPHLVPKKNFGVLARIYDNFVDPATVYIGHSHGHKNFFLIDKFDGTEFLPGFGSGCPKTLQGSSEGICYPQYTTKKDTLRYWRKSICKVMDLKYEKDVARYGLKAYRFVLENVTYDRSQPDEEDCYKGEPKLPNGLSDISPCYYGAPIAVSFPHFLFGDDSLRSHVNGLEPNEEKHQSSLILEPVSGVCLNGLARSQSNLVMRKLTYFTPRVQKFSQLVIPLVWIEYNLLGVPWYVHWLLKFLLLVLPTGQRFFTAFLMICGTALVFSFYRRRKRRMRSHLTDNKTLRFEAEAFIKA